MINKAIILAGGTGTRLKPITLTTNKQLLPIYDKPLIYYPLSSLMLAGIRNILIIVNKGLVQSFKKILSDGSHLGIKILYKEQSKPTGIPDAFTIGEKFIKSDNIALILGDNFFFGTGFTGLLEKAKSMKSGCYIFLKDVKNPKNYGVAVIKNKKVFKIVEKPKKFKRLNNIIILKSAPTISIKRRNQYITYSISPIIYFFLKFLTSGCYWKFFIIFH